MDKQKRPKWKKRLIVLGILAGVFVVLLVAGVEFTSRSTFCASCHYMKPYFKSWQESSHSQFECGVCHYPPGGLRSKLEKKIEGLVMVGRYWTKLYMKSKPWAEIKDESCLRQGCHDKRLLEGRVKFKSVVFDHKIHLTDLKRGKKLQCTSCHSQIVQGKHITVTEGSCFICHFKESEHYPKISDCSHCHTKDTLVSAAVRFNHTLVFDNGFACIKCHSNTIMGDGEVPRENCYKCHMEKERLEQYENTDMLHRKHITENKIECNQCHMDIQHKIIKDIETISDCRTCHTDFHKAQKILYSGSGGMGIDHPMPNIMFEKGLSCKGCHIFHEQKGGKALKSETLVSQPSACESCHGRGYERVLKDWELSTQSKLGEIKAIFRRAQREVRRSKSRDKAKALDLLKEASFNMEIVEKGKSVHNISFSQQLLGASYKKIKEALTGVNAPYKPPAFVTAPKNVPSECASCHAGIEDVKAGIWGVEFSHKKHVVGQKMNCSSCHTNIRKHGELTATKKSCASCHHTNPAKDCGDCHSLQKTFYEGGQMESAVVPKDVMAEAEVGCRDCHTLEGKGVIRPEKSACINCHDEDYGEMFTEWQTTIRGLVKAIVQSIKVAEKNGLSVADKQDLAKARSVLKKIRTDGSSGVHNFTFMEDTLTNLINKIKSINTAKR